MIVVAGGEPITPPPEPTPSEPPRETHALSWTWIAPWMDTQWRLSPQGEDGVLKLRGATGTGKTDPTHRWKDSPQLDGSEWDGVRIGRGQLFVPLHVVGVDSADFLANNDALIRSLTPRQEGVMRITRPDGSWRQIGCRYAGGADLAMNLDPVKACRATYPVTWENPDPYWRGEPVRHHIPWVDPVPFFPGPPFTLDPGLSLAAAADVTNPGHVDSWGVWRVDGPFTSFTLGIGSAVVSMTHTAAAGQWVEIDMNPRKRTVLDQAGGDVWLDLTAAEFAPIPPGTSPLVTTVNGPATGTAVTLTFVPGFETGW